MRQACEGSESQSEATKAVYEESESESEATMMACEGIKGESGETMADWMEDLADETREAFENV